MTRFIFIKASVILALGTGFISPNVSHAELAPVDDLNPTRFGSVRFIEMLDEVTYPEGTFELDTVETGNKLYLDDPVIADQSGNGREGLVESPGGNGTFSSSVPESLTGSLMSFDLSGQVFLDVSGYKGVSGSNPRSVAGWIFPNALEGSQNIVEWGTGASGERWTVRLDGSRLRTEVAGGFAIAETEINAGEWNHVAVTFEGGDVQDVSLFINGVLQPFFNSSGQAINTAEDFDVRIGSSPVFGGRWLDGSIDEFGIWERALSQEEVENLAGGASASEIGDGLALYFDFESGGGDFFNASITSLPAELSGNLAIKTKNDPAARPLEDLSSYFGFVVDRPTTVYIAYDEDAIVPSWIGDRYSQTGMRVETTVGGFDLWSRDFNARDQVTLLFDNGVQDPDDNNYWVILSEGPEVITEGQDTGHVRKPLADWRLRPHNLLLTKTPRTETTLMSHDFSSGEGALNETQLTTGDGVWEAGPAFRADGTISAEASAAAWLPFTPEPGFEYTASLTIFNDDSNWVAFGFMPATPPDSLSWTGTEMNLRHTNRTHAWALVREEDQAGFLGGGTQNQIFKGTFVDTSEPVTITIVLNTAEPVWTAAFSLNDFDGGVHPLPDSASSGPIAIGGIGVSRLNASAGISGFISDFSVTAVPIYESENVDSADMLDEVPINPDAGFTASTDIRVPRLQGAGDSAFGFSLLGDGTDTIRAVWLPREQGGGSTLQLMDAVSGDILEQLAWNGLIPTMIDNAVGVSEGADETVFSVGSPFHLGEAFPVIFDEDFESDALGWTSGSNNQTADQWEIGQPTSGPNSAFNGQNVAATNLAGGYDAHSDSWLRSPVVDLTDVSEATLRFQEFLDADWLEEDGNIFHFATVSVVDADSSETTEIARYTTVEGETLSWKERVLDLSEFAGRLVSLEFRFVSDQFLDNAGDGWYIDDIQLTSRAASIVSMPEQLTLDGTLPGIATDKNGLSNASESYVEFTVADRAASGNMGVTVYVAWDIRASGLEPNWLRKNFTLTDHFVGVSNGAGHHRLWAREYADGEEVTLGGASAPGSGPFPAGTSNYFVLFGDARPGLETVYTLTAEGIREDGVWGIDFSLIDANGFSQTVSASIPESLEGRNEFGLFGKYSDVDDGNGMTRWEIFDLSIHSPEAMDSSGFEAWQEQHFGEPGDSEVSGPNASPAGDGVKNLMKYALNLDPWEPASSADLPQLGLSDEGKLILMYSMRTDIDDIEYIPAVSEDLIEWKTGDPYVVQFFGEIDDVENVREVEAVGSVSEEAGRAFLRLVIRQKEE